MSAWNIEQFPDLIIAVEIVKIIEFYYLERFSNNKFIYENFRPICELSRWEQKKVLFNLVRRPTCSFHLTPVMKTDYGFFHNLNWSWLLHVSCHCRRAKVFASHFTLILLRWQSRCGEWSGVSSYSASFSNPWTAKLCPCWWCGWMMGALVTDSSRRNHASLIFDINLLIILPISCSTKFSWRWQRVNGKLGFNVLEFALHWLWLICSQHSLRKSCFKGDSKQISNNQMSKWLKIDCNNLRT